MESDKDKKPTDEKPAEDKPAEQNTQDKGEESATQHDALDQPTEDQENSGVIDATSAVDKPKSGADKETKPAKPPNALKQTLKRFNLYLLIVVLVVVIGAVILIVNDLNGKKPSANITIGSQPLSTSQLKQLANSKSTGGIGSTLTVQGNASFTGQVQAQSGLDVAGTVETGSQLSLPQLTVSGTANLGVTQLNNLQIAQSATFQGSTTFQTNINVAGTTNFTGPTTIGSLTVTNLTLGGDDVIQDPAHIEFTGASPGRTIDFNVLGGGGSASIFGSDTNGTVAINTGNSPVAGCFVDIRFNIPFPTTPNVIIGPVNQAAGAAEYYVVPTQNDFKICTYNAAEPNQVFSYTYLVTE